MKIRIHSFANTNSYPYFEYMVTNYRSLASHPENLEFIGYAMSREAAAKLKNHPQCSRVVEVYRLPQYFVMTTWKEYVKAAMAILGIRDMPLRGSNGHATGLNAAFKFTGKGAIDLIADSDTVFLQRGWDDIIERTLETTGIFGTCYEDIGSANAGTGLAQTYKRKPNLTWLALSPRYDFTRLKVNPLKKENLKITTPELSDLYNLPVGYELARDVGWMLPNYLHDNAIPYKVFTHVKHADGARRVIQSGNDYHEEFHLDGVPFLGHQRGSHQHRFRATPISAAFYDAVEKYLAAPPMPQNAAA